MAASTTKVHFLDTQSDRRSLCHTYITGRRTVVLTSKQGLVTCARCQSKLSGATK